MPAAAVSSLQFDRGSDAASSPNASPRSAGGSPSGAAHATPDWWHGVLVSVGQFGAGNGTERDQALRIEEVLGNHDAALVADGVA